MYKRIGEIKTNTKETISITRKEDERIGINLKDGFDSCYGIFEKSEVEELIKLLTESLEE
jgi:hypothetical protein